MNTKSAFVAIVGAPNVGKSTLLNALIGEKIAIVTDKPQTTRNRITGIITQEETQLVFLDTPGWHKAQTSLSDYMLREIKESLSGIELVLVMTESYGKIKENELELIKNLKARQIPAILLVNKVDAIEQKEQMIPKIHNFSQLYDFDEIYPISAKTGQGLDILLEKVKTYAKDSPHFFDEDSYTDQPERVIISEIVREKLMRNLWEELPHGIAVVVESMKERPEQNLMDIHATIFCERDSHKGMIIGKKGKMLQTVGSQARSDIEAFLDIPVNLQLWVKVKKDWRNKENIIRQLGFDSD